jgi:tetratricopeptide (TPR) repeat protein/transcriptional regulator with XRE-family HTH domain
MWQDPPRVNGRIVVSVANRRGSASADRPSNGRRTAIQQFGRALRTLRERHGLSQRGLYTKSLVHYSIINRLESGKLPPTVEAAAALDEALDADGALTELAKAARTEPSAGLPPAPLHFVGRAPALAALSDHLLVEPDTVPLRSRVVFICGTPGVGKTALSRYWASVNANQFDQILYADLHGYGPQPPAEPAEILENLLHGLGVRADRLPRTDELRLALLQGLLEQRQSVGQHVLIVLDNARDSRRVKQVLPGTPNTSVLVTSRSWLAGLVIGAHAKGIRLRPMNRLEASELVGTFIGDVRAVAEPESVNRLVELCGFLPIALNIAAERVAANELKTVQQHVDELAERGRLELRAEDDDTVQVRAAFRWSYQSLDPDQARVFRLIGLHPGLELSAASVGALCGVSATEAGRLLDQLVQRSLLEQTGSDVFRLHDLLRIYAAEEANRPEWDSERRAAVHRVASWYLHTANAASWSITPGRADHHIHLDPPPDGVHPLRFESFAEAYAWSERELSAIPGIAELALQENLLFPAWRIPVEFFDFFIHHRPIAAWIDCHEVAVKAAEKSGDPLRIAQAAEELAEGYLRRGRPADLDRACELTNRAIEVCEGLAPNRFVAFAYIEMGNVQYLRRNYAESARLCEQALKVAQSAGAFIGETLSRTHLGNAYRELGQFDLAVQHGRRSFEMLEEQQDQHGMGFAAVPLARTYRLAGRLDLAQHYCEQGESAFDKSNDLEGRAEAQGEKALVLLARGAAEEAKVFLDTAISQLEKLNAKKAESLLSEWRTAHGSDE